MAVEQDLGAVVKRYNTDNQRRRRICLVAVPLGLIAACVGFLMAMLVGGPAAAGGALFIPSLVMGVGLGSFLVGLWQGRLSFTRRDESFTVYEHGLVHAYSGKSWAISWDEIDKVTDNSRDNMLNRALGGDVNYSIKLRSPIGGRRYVVITGVTEDAVWLGETVEQAVHDRKHPSR